MHPTIDYPTFPGYRVLCISSLFVFSVSPVTQLLPSRYRSGNRNIQTMSTKCQ
jgi:hypothetical protein